MPAGKLHIVPLGGLGEFGMNCMAIRWADDIIVVDAGLMFPESELLGVDIVVPDITYLLQNRDKVRGIVLTHGHEDHIGGLPWIMSELNRSEEHTSELQSHSDLVCRLLLEKKKKEKANDNGRQIESSRSRS